MSSKELKTHLYTDCTGFDWRATDDERNARTTASLVLVTCGQCKGKLLDRLRKTDWSTLDIDTLTVLWCYA